MTENEVTMLMGKAVNIIPNSVIVIEEPNGNLQNVVLNSLDVPKFGHRPGGPSAGWCSERGGYEAREYLRLLVMNRTVVANISGRANSQVFAEVYLIDGPYPQHSVNEAIVREGLAQMSEQIRRNTPYYERISAVEKEAQHERLGMHNPDTFIHPAPHELTGSELEEFFQSVVGTKIEGLVEYISPTYQMATSFPKHDHKRCWVALSGVTMMTNKDDLQFEKVQERVTEYIRDNCLWKTVKIQPLVVNSTRGSIAGLVYISKNEMLNELLVRKGYMFIFEPVVRDHQKELGALFDAEEQAKKDAVGMYEDFVSIVSKPIRTFHGTLIECLSGECAVISEHDSSIAPELGVLQKVYLTLVRAPFGENNDDVQEAARSALAKAIKGRYLTVTLDHEVELPNKTIKQYGTIFVGTTNVALSLLSKGFLRVMDSRQAPPNSNRYIYVKAAASAPDIPPVKPIVWKDLAEKSPLADSVSKKSLESWFKDKNFIDAQAIFMLGPTKLKVAAKGLLMKLLVSVSDLICPRRDEPFGMAALNYAKMLLMHTALRIKIISLDRSGSYLCTVQIMNEQGLLVDFRHKMLSAGYASLFFENRDKVGRALQDKAMEQKVGQWSNPAILEQANHGDADCVPSTIDGPTEKIEIEDAIVVHVNSVDEFYVVNWNSSTKQTNQNMLKLIDGDRLQSVDAATVGKNNYYVARYSGDEGWYRVKILQLNRKQGQVKVYYGDFGNTDTIQLTDLRVIPEEFHPDNIPFFAKPCRFGGCRNVTSIEEELNHALYSATDEGLYRAILYQDYNSEKYICFLYEKGGDCINLRLLANGLAISNPSNYPKEMEDFKAVGVKAAEEAIAHKKGIYTYVNSVDDD